MFEDDFSEIIGEACWMVVDALGENYDYTQDGQFDNYINTFYKDGEIILEVADSELYDFENAKSIKKYILNKIKNN